MYHSIIDWRSRRNQLNNTMPQFNSSHYPIANYCTDQTSEIILNKLQMLPNPLQKNLADTLVTAQESITTKMPSKTSGFSPNNGTIKINDKAGIRGNRSSDFYSSLSGISSFFSGVMSVITDSIFNKSSKSQTSEYYECYNDFNICHDGSPSLHTWHNSNIEDQNKSERAHDQLGNSYVIESNMNDCWVTADLCEDKINKVRLLLSSKTIPIPSPKLHPRRSKKAFVEKGSVEDNFEDAFTPEDFVTMSNKTYLECVSPINNHYDNFSEVDAAMIKTEIGPIHDNMDIVRNLPQLENSNNKINSWSIERELAIDKKTPENIKETEQVVSSCEDKLSTLKAMLLKRSKCINNKFHSVTEPVTELEINEKSKKKLPSTTKLQDKRYKNPKRMSAIKRQKCQLKRNINDDINFAHDNSEIISSAENSPSIRINNLLTYPSSLESDMKLGSTPETKEYFDEVNGCFNSSSVESNDAFQIVFTDDPVISRIRKTSDCESEDSFIIFEDTPDSCYTSNDVFGIESDCEDSDEDLQSDSECSDSGLTEVTCKLSHNLSRSFGDLTDDSLYGVQKCDEVDCSVRVCDEISSSDLVDATDVTCVDIEKEENVSSKGLLMTPSKKRMKRNQPPKRVQFSTEPPKVHVMCVWSFAARQARAGNWEQFALDRDRFKRKIANMEMAISWVLKPQHRSRVMFQRFMPWWNEQKRLETAEKKAEEEKCKVEKQSEGDGIKELAKKEDKDLNEVNGYNVVEDEISGHNAKDPKHGNNSDVSNEIVEHETNSPSIDDIIFRTDNRLTSVDKNETNKVPNGLKIDNCDKINNIHEDKEAINKCIVNGSIHLQSIHEHEMI